MALWTVMAQNPATGQTRQTGEPTQTSLYLAKRCAQELAWARRNETFFVQNEKGRVPAVYHYVKTVD